MNWVDFVEQVATLLDPVDSAEENVDTINPNVEDFTVFRRCGVFEGRRDVVVDCELTAVFKRCGVVEECSSSTRFKVEGVAAGLLMLKDAIDSLIVDGMLVKRRGVDSNRRVLGFELSVVVDAIISVDGMTEDSEDKR